MKTTVLGRHVETAINEKDREILLLLLRRLGPHSKVSELRSIPDISSNELWWRLVIQVCVRGSASGMERIGKDPRSLKEFRRLTALRVWKQHKFKVGYLSGIFKQFGATRFPSPASKSLRKILAAPLTVRDNHVVLLRDLPRSGDVDVVRDALIARCPGFKLKSASDFMISVGLSRDVIALDTRVVGFLQRYLDYEVKAQVLQQSRPKYLSVEAALRTVCKEAGCDLAVLDRTIFQFSTMSSVQFAMEIDEIEWRRS